MSTDTQRNVIDPLTRMGLFKNINGSFSVSSRNISPDIDIVDYLKVVYMYCNLEDIKDVFGSTTDYTPLYGGRTYIRHRSLTETHVRTLNDMGIGIALTLTNHYFDMSVYREAQGMLKKNHAPVNSIVCTNDELAIRIKNDFPDYEVKASIIKNLDTVEKIERAFDTYDSVTIPMDKNDDDLFLRQLPNKDRVILFGNANCAYTCPNRTCYLGFSKKMFDPRHQRVCSRQTIDRLDVGEVYFNVKKLEDLGYSGFKLVPITSPDAEGTARALSSRKNYFLNDIGPKKRHHVLCSYPKSGRTWLRFILAQYLNSLFGLAMDIDFHTLFHLMPNHGFSPDKGFNVYHFSDDPRIPLISSTHSDEPNSLKTVDSIFLMLRNIKDVVVSDYYHVSRLLDRFDGDIKSFIRQNDQGLERYLEYLNHWAPIAAKSHVLVLSYERLKEHPVETLEEILNKMDIIVERDILDKALEFATFNNMQRIERDRGIAGHPDKLPDREDSMRVRKGVPHGYRDDLANEDIDYIDKRSREALTPEALNLVKTWGLLD